MTIVIALAGLFLGIGNAAWMLFNQGFRDRARLKLSLRFGRFTDSPSLIAIPGQPRPDEWMLFLDVSNRGRRPATIQTSGLVYPRNDAGVGGTFFGGGLERLPARLEEGENVTLWARSESLYEEVVSMNLPLPTHAYADDSLGNRHRQRLPAKLLDALRREIAKRKVADGAGQSG